MENTLARKLKQVPEGYLIIGVDPHKKRHAVVAITQDFTTRDRFKLDNTREGLEFLLRRVRAEMLKSVCRGVILSYGYHGIALHGFFIFGFDGDDEAVFERTVAFAQQMRLESAQFDILTPYPGTALYESMDKAGRIITKDWSQYGYNPVFEPKSMSREVLQKGRDWAWREFYSLPSIWNRVGVARRNLAKLWALNLYFRRHWKAKSPV